MKNNKSYDDILKEIRQAYKDFKFQKELWIKEGASQYTLTIEQYERLYGKI